VGLPLRVDDRLFNCAVLLHRGHVLGAVPKSYVPNYREFYERRQFAPASQALSRSIALLGQDVPFGPHLLFEAANVPGSCCISSLRGRLGATAAEHARRARRRHGDRETFPRAT
jgi:hypothetical protein